MAIDLFETRTMLPMVELSIGSNNYLRSRFFSNVVTFNSIKVDVDVVGPNGRKLAPFVNPKLAGVVIANEGYRTDTYEAPRVSAQKVTEAEDMLLRSPGEIVYASKSPEQRAAEKIGKDLRELHDIITRREEAMCAEALFTGKVTVKGEGYDETIDYLAGDTTYKTTATTLWSATGADIFGDCRAIRRSMLQKGGVAPTEMICGANVIEAIIDKLTADEKLDYRRVDMGQINPAMLPQGVTYWGYLKDSALDIYSYDEWYLDENNAEQPMVPEDYVLFASPNARTTMAYGCVNYADPKTDTIHFYAEPRVPFSWVQRQAPTGRVVQVQSRPLPILNCPWNFKVLKAV